MEASATLLDCKSYPILYIDDEPDNLEAFRDEFEDYFTIHTAGSGPEGLDVIRREPIALALVDQRMPGMSGVEVMEAIRKEHPDVLRVMITAYTDLDVVIDAINRGAVYQYFRKPWDHEDIRTGVMRGIEVYHLKQESRRLQAERVENMKKMVRSNRLAAVGTMVSGLVHEIRNPMVAIQTFFQLLHRRWEDREFMARYLQIAQGESDRIEKLLETLLSFARPIRPVLRPCDLNEIVERILQLLSLQARKKRLEVKFEKEDALPGIVADPNQMVQVVQNLGLNAIQATEAPGFVLFRTFACGDSGGNPRVGLEIRDSGSGISEENLEKIFDPFFTTKEDGNGLGLSICYQIASEHGGHLEARSRVGEGTSFFLYLPGAVKVSPGTDRRLGEEPARSACASLFVA